MEQIGTKPNDPISPTTEIGNNQEISQGFGLTKREHMAIEFTKALLSNSTLSINGARQTIYDAVNDGIFCADELIRKLNPEQ